MFTSLEGEILPLITLSDEEERNKFDSSDVEAFSLRDGRSEDSLQKEEKYLEHS